MAANKKVVLDTIDDLVSRFLYYDRKEDEDLPRGRIEELVKAGDISVDEMVERFRAGLKKSL